VPKGVPKKAAAKATPNSAPDSAPEPEAKSYTTDPYDTTATVFDWAASHDESNPDAATFTTALQVSLWAQNNINTRPGFVPKVRCAHASVNSLQHVFASQNWPMPRIEYAD
jgi:hypothetical protein